MNIFTVTNDVREILLRSEELKSLIGDKIFPIVAPENTDGDFICYQRDRYKQERCKMGNVRDNPSVYVSCVSADYDRSQQIASLVRDVLEGEYEDMNIELEECAEDFDSDKYIQIMLFSIYN